MDCSFPVQPFSLTSTLGTSLNGHVSVATHMASIDVLLCNSEPKIRKTAVSLSSRDR